MAGFAGDVTVEEAWQALRENPESVLVDVRTEAEWAFVGICDLRPLNKQPLFISWQVYPDMQVNNNFIPMLEAQLNSRSAPVYFICRSGARSRAAAQAAAAAGYEACYNVAGGFEGEKDNHHHRGVVNGWKAAGLPWIQQ
ncbi:rhodanese-like domain-containing protein [Luteithermobacter gelatinilyticus]|uniref:rhodanese-like domain-containing protein n=1 Tax=Luteithermobacter gelatinilyticus TaxID=2582913 RepID=UPI001106B2D2|nr:rhodanese-like domain-containing protein [Luteithermobacter gelatinilyticus]|tara:strand:+ start:5964 stop:6383 length:420 start_codon:yes stop_codon:yes gene_type:complete